MRPPLTSTVVLPVPQESRHYEPLETEVVSHRRGRPKTVRPVPDDLDDEAEDDDDAPNR